MVKLLGQWKIEKQGFFKSGKLNGIWNSFSPEGILLLSGTYKNGTESKRVENI